VGFPISFFTGALVFDILGLVQEKGIFHQTAMYLDAAGIVGALAAAIPGIIDYFATVPPESTAKKRATKHALTNIINLALFIAILVYRRRAGATLYLITGLELAGFILLGIAGWMGGTLVYRNQIGVNPR